MVFEPLQHSTPNTIICQYSSRPRFTSLALPCIFKSYLIAQGFRTHIAIVTIKVITVNDSQQMPNVRPGGSLRADIWVIHWPGMTFHLELFAREGAVQKGGPRVRSVQPALP